MAARIYTGTGPSMSTESEFSVGNIFKMMNAAAESKRLESAQLLQEAKFQYEKDTADKLQRSMTRLSDIGSGFDWENTISDPSAMFGAPLASVKEAYDKYSKGQLADGVGVSAGAFQNMYNASAIRNLNMQIGSYNALKSKLQLAHPEWSEEDGDYDAEMAKVYHADNLFTKYTQIGGGLMDQVSAVDPTTGQAVQLMGLDYTPKQPTVGIGQRLMGLFKDPYTEKWRGTSITGLGAAGLAGLFTKRQAGQGVETITKHAKNVLQGGLDAKAWSKLYGKKTKAQVLKEAKSLAYKGTTLGKLAGKTKGVLPYAAPAAGKAIGSLAGETGEKVGHATGIAGMAKMLKVPAKAKSFGKFLLKKVPKILGSAGAIAMADSPAPGLADLMALGFTAYEIKQLLFEWNKGEAGD